MQMKKNLKFRLIDLAIVILCIAGSAASGTVFWQEYNRTLNKLNEDPVGTIVFKRRTAERKFIDRIIWDRLRDTSSVYNGDTIRTIELSEAILTFRDDATRLTLNANTLIQIFYSEKDGARVDFTGGRMEVSSPREMIVTYGSSQIIIEGQVNLNKSDEGFNISVLRGGAVFDGQVIQAGEIYALDAAGHRDFRPVIAMTSFGSSARIMGETEESIPVLFAWNSSNFTPETYVTVEIAHDGEFINLIESYDSMANSAVIPVDSGNYWWRAYPAARGEPVNQLYPSGTLEVIASSLVSLVSPAGAAEIVRSESGVSFSWTAVQGASLYNLEISANSNMSNPVVSRIVEGTNIILGELDINAWYWRITPVLPSWVTGSVSPSPTGNFSVVRERSALLPPELVYPLPSENIYLDTGANALIWTFDPNAASWIVEIADNPLFNNSVIRQTVTSNFFPLPEYVLQDGRKWHWQVSALGGANPSVSEGGNFQVFARMPFIEPDPVAAPEPEQPEEIEPQPEQSQTQPPSALQPLPAQPAVPQSQPSQPVPQSRPQQPAIIPQPVQVPQPEPVPVQPEPLPVIPGSEPQPVPEQQPDELPQDEHPLFTEEHPVIVPLTTEENIIEGLIRISAAGTVFNAFPTDGYILSHEQIENALSIIFSWQGNAGAYRFALYKSTGEAFVPPTQTLGSSYELVNPGILTDGDYVWQVFENDSQGRWNDLPSAAHRLFVEQRELRTLPSSNPGALYGNR
jgi:hypothetical protein